MEPTSSPDTSRSPQGEQSSDRSRIVEITIRGSSTSAAKAVQKFLSQAQCAEIIHALGVVSVVIDCKKSVQQVSLEVKKDSVHLAIPPRGLSEQQLTKETARVLIGFAITQTVTQAAEHFAARGVACSAQEDKLTELLKQYSALQDGQRQQRGVLLARALTPYQRELEQ